MRRLILGLILCMLAVAPAPACVGGPEPPGTPRRFAPPGAHLDALLSPANVPGPNAARIKELRDKVVQAAANGHEKLARQMEARVLHGLGFERVWMFGCAWTYGWTTASDRPPFAFANDGNWDALITPWRRRPARHSAGTPG